MLPQLIWGLIMSQPFENEVAGALNTKLKLSCILLVTQAIANAGKQI